MGCSQSKPEVPSVNGVDLKDVKKEAGVDFGGTRATQRRGSLTLTELPELQSKLEKLDEERTRVQEELKRLQSAAALEQDTEMPEGNSSNGGDKPRVRFSKFDGIDMSCVLPVPTPSDRMERPVSRRTSSANTIARLSSYRASSSSNDTLPGQRRSDAGFEGGRDIKALTEMVNRGRRRTRFTHRPSASEASAAASVSGDTKVNYLPRGGVHVQTKYGAVQFGLPPETIKDSMQMKLQVRCAPRATLLLSHSASHE